MTIKWVKPSGQEIETNDKEETIEYCESLGWERAKKKPGPKPKVKTDDSRD